MEPKEDSTLEDFQRWQVSHLKDFLAKSGLSRSGKKAELAALAYSCHVMKKPLTNSLTCNISETFGNYQAILNLPNGSILPDPFKISNGWLSEKDGGMKHWPPLSVVDTIDSFREQNTNTDKMLSEYKAGQAYDYFKSGWLKEIHYNSLNQLSTANPGIDQYSLLKAKCTPSQRINDPDHDVWVLAGKVTGNVIRSYCNCAAG